MEWNKLEGQFWRSGNGRFDLLVNVAGVWVVYDGDTGTRAEFDTRGEAETWAEQRGHTRDENKRFVQQQGGGK